MKNVENGKKWCFRYDMAMVDQCEVCESCPDEPETEEEEKEEREVESCSTGG